jgi:hypothetical protein
MVSARGKNFLEGCGIMAFVLMLYFLAARGGDVKPTQTGGGRTSAAEHRYHQLMCQPLPSRHISPHITAGDTGYVHVLPRPKIIDYPGKNSSDRRAAQRGVLSFAPSVSIEVDVRRARDAQLAVHAAFEADRLCTLSRSVAPGVGGQEDRGDGDVVNGSSVLYIYTVKVAVVSDEEYYAQWASPAAPGPTEEGGGGSGGGGGGGGGADVYTIDVSGGVLSIHTPSIQGLRHAMATASQVMENPAALALPLRLCDWPTSHWRGLMLDVARHFLPVRKIYRVLDAMHAMKLNFLHLHLSDSQVGATPCCVT